MAERPPLPGEYSLTEKTQRMLRVDHAGEYGAMRIYAGQLAVLKDAASRDAISHMAKQEEKHLKTFEALMTQRHVRPTALMPLWHVAGFALGAATALLGKEAAMACTVAVESVIDEHYATQEKALPGSESALKQTLSEFRADEKAHHDTGLAYGAEKAPFYAVLHHGVASATRLAIWLSTRV